MDMFTCILAGVALSGGVRMDGYFYLNPSRGCVVWWSKDGYVTLNPSRGCVDWWSKDGWICYPES